MVRIYRDGASYMVQTTCLDLPDFLAQLAEAFANIPHGADSIDDAIAYGAVMELAAPIMFRMAGYKADNVSEQRTLVCGHVSPNETKVLASAR